MDLSRLLNIKSKPVEKPAQEAPLGSGIAEKGRQVLKSIPYQKHLQEAKAMGFEPMTPEEFSQVQGMGR